MERELSLVDSVTTIENDGTFKSWKETFTSDDVENFLQENKVEDLTYDGICGDGDILLLTAKGTLSVLDFKELERVKNLFNAPQMLIEPYENEILITLSWNV